MPGLKPDEFLRRMSKGQPIGGVLLLGGDRYLREVCRKKIIEVMVPEAARDWGVTRYSAEDDDLATIIGQAQTLPMLAPRQVLVVDEVNAWERLGDDSRDALLKTLNAYLENPAPFTVLVFEAGTLDQRTKLAKALAERMLVVATELSDDLTARIALAAELAPDMARAIGVQMDADAAGELSEALNGELAAMRTEIEKLAAYAGDARRVTIQDIEALTISARKYSVWELSDMLASRQPKRALEFLDSILREGEAPAMTIGAMAWMFRKLMEAQQLPLGTSGGQAASRLRMRPETAELAMRSARKFSREQLVAALAALYEADSRVKSGAASQRAVMEFLVAELSGGMAAAKSAGNGSAAAARLP